ncbi:unnamed protein product [Ceutorhynchus assimilis]|uniref:Transmembrane protein n=1 Tax=Ceutorhynchus assimilis TaxID=467358 RepID=A0A9N9MUR3_9CUCU|nr:unnamed protein product [Ceutorhynchus assimilis]
MPSRRPEGFLEKIKQHPKFSFIVAGVSYTLLTIVSAIALLVYFTQIAENSFWHWQLVAYTLMLANALCGFTEFLSDEESFCPLRNLLDYFQLVLVLPCYAAEMWMKYEMGPPEIAAAHAGLGILAALVFVFGICRRQDLTDLAIFVNGFSLLCMALLNVNPFTLLATLAVVGGYCVYRRQDYQCCMAPQDKYNIAMVLFAVISLASFDDFTAQSFQDAMSALPSVASFTTAEE